MKTRKLTRYDQLRVGMRVAVVHRECDLYVKSSLIQCPNGDFQIAFVFEGQSIELRVWKLGEDYPCNGVMDLEALQPVLVGDIVKDRDGETYKVLEVFQNSILFADSKGDADTLMSFARFERERYQVEEEPTLVDKIYGKGPLDLLKKERIEIEAIDLDRLRELHEESLRTSMIYTKAGESSVNYCEVKKEYVDLVNKLLNQDKQNGDQD